jgi:hypothetical protein
MKGIFTSLLVAILIVSVSLTGCGAKKAESSKEAIDMAKTMETAQEKANYLIGQAKAFYNSKEFQDAVDVAQYVLRYVDKDSQQAKDLVEKAKAQLTSAAKGALANFGK